MNDQLTTDPLDLIQSVAARAFPFLPTVILDRAMAEIRIEGARLGIEVVAAEHNGLTYAAAATRQEDYPTIARVHHGIVDLLQFEVPIVLRPLIRRLLRSSPPEDALLLRKSSLRLAAANKQCVPSALARFAWYESLRLTAWLFALIASPELEAFGELRRFDAEAESILRERLSQVREEDAADLSPDALMAEVLVLLQGMLERTQHELALASVAARSAAEDLVEFTVVAHALEGADAVLLREALQDPAASRESARMAHRHPLVFASANAVDQRRRRLKSRILNGTVLPAKRKIRLIDLIAEALEGRQ